jgi:molecular chaperone GrpE
MEDIEADEIDARLEAILEEVPDPFADALRQRDEYLDDLRRLQAEFENYRKRVARQSDEVTDRATAAVLERILPALDALDLARDHAGEPVDETAKQLASALAQISSLLRDALAKDGLDRIDEVGVEFDPAIHDAVAHEPAEDDAHGVVVAQVLRAGYRLKGRVVRPAMVKVRG